MVRSTNLTIAGIWNIVVGVLMLLLGLFGFLDFLAGLGPRTGQEGLVGGVAVFIPLGSLALAGGIFALKKKHWRLAMIFSAIDSLVFLLTLIPLFLLLLSEDEFK